MPEVAAPPPLGSKVSVWWPLRNEWLSGKVLEVRSGLGEGAHVPKEVHVAYFGDGSNHWHSLADTQIRLCETDGVGSASVLDMALPPPERLTNGFPPLEPGLPFRAGPDPFANMPFVTSGAPPESGPEGMAGHTKEIHLPPATSGLLAPPAPGLEFSLPVQLAMPVLMPPPSTSARPNLRHFNVTMNPPLHPPLHPAMFDPYSTLLPIASATPLSAPQMMASMSGMPSVSSLPTEAPLNGAPAPAPTITLPPLLGAPQDLSVPMMSAVPHGIDMRPAAPGVEAAAKAVAALNRTATVSPQARVALACLRACVWTV